MAAVSPPYASSLTGDGTRAHPLIAIWSDNSIAWILRDGDWGCGFSSGAGGLDHVGLISGGEIEGTDHYERQRKGQAADSPISAGAARTRG
jgi:hypothetical protein